MPWKSKFTEPKSEVSCTNFLTTNCVQKLPENELAIVSATNEYTSVEDRVMETNSKAVRGSIHFSDTNLSPEIVRKPPGGHYNNNKVYHSYRETGLLFSEYVCCQAKGKRAAR